MKGCGSPCGACKFLRRKCAKGCVFAPYFSYEQAPAHFAAIHKVFGASNVAKLLVHLPMTDRSEAAVTISYEAQARLQDPIYVHVILDDDLDQVVNLQAQLDAVKEQAAAQFIMNCSSSTTTGNPNHHKPYGGSPSNCYNFPQDVHNWCQNHVGMSQLDANLNNDDDNNIESMLHFDSRTELNPNPNSVKYENWGLIPEEYASFGSMDSPHEMKLNNRHWPFDQEEDGDHHDLQSLAFRYIQYS
ncbi:LOB domain-containing protein 29 [Sesamum alatum]|uniref:LOB domain-containing protein 29 n=1 Tax=Sesamum alatum TaxID=300844 RepID=A0AAE1Z3M4_9LAMI|nr:LOB domain-containing protein 29 [Sesamum alatum]